MKTNDILCEFGDTDLINELRGRGLHVIAFAPSDVQGYEMENGPVEMTEEEAASILYNAGKDMQDAMMEKAWDSIGSSIGEFERARRLAHLQADAQAAPQGEK